MLSPLPVEESKYLRQKYDIIVKPSRLKTNPLAQYDQKQNIHQHFQCKGPCYDFKQYSNTDEGPTIISVINTRKPPEK